MIGSRNAAARLDDDNLDREPALRMYGAALRMYGEGELVAAVRELYKCHSLITPVDKATRVEV